MQHYLIGRKFIGEKWRENRFVTKFYVDEEILLFTEEDFTEQFTKIFFRIVDLTNEFEEYKLPLICTLREYSITNKI